MDFEIIIADDNMSSTDPFVRRLEKKYPNTDVKLFSEIQKCLDYIFDNLSQKMIVFLDCKFDVGLQDVLPFSRSSFDIFKGYLTVSIAVPIEGVPASGSVPPKSMNRQSPANTSIIAAAAAVRCRGESSSSREAHFPMA